MAVSSAHRVAQTQARSGAPGVRRSNAAGGRAATEYSVGVARVPGAKAPGAKTAAAKPAAAKVPAAAKSPVARTPEGATSSAITANDAARRRRLTQRLLGPAERVIGLDVARGIAVVATVAGLTTIVVSPRDAAAPASATSSGGQLLEPSTWGALVGSGSLLVLAGIVFAIVGGSSTSLLSGGYEGLSGLPQLHARLRTLTRAALFALAGFVVLSAGYSIGRSGPEWSLGRSSALSPTSLWALVVTVTVPAALFAGGLLLYLGCLAVAELVFTRCGSALLFTVAAMSAVIVPLIAAFTFEHSHAPVTDAAAAFLPWICLYLAGMAIGRLRLDLLWVRLVLFGSGCALAALGFSAAWVWSSYVAAANAPPSGSPLAALLSAVWPTGAADALPNAAQNGFASFVAGAPPSVFFVVGLGGIGLAVIAVGLLVGTALRRALLPISAAGTLALSIGAIAVTVSCVVALAAPTSPLATLVIDTAARVEAIEVPGRQLHWLLPTVVCVATLLLATLWRLAFGPGLLERLFSLLSRQPGRGIFFESAPTGAETGASSVDHPVADITAAPSETTAAISTQAIETDTPDTAAAPSAPADTAPAFAALLTPPLPGVLAPDLSSSLSAQSASADDLAPPAGGSVSTPAIPPRAASTPRATPQRAGEPSSPVGRQTSTNADSSGSTAATAEQHSNTAAPPAEQPTDASTPRPKARKPDPEPHSEPVPEPAQRTPPTISPIRSTWSPGQTLGRLPY